MDEEVEIYTELTMEEIKEVLSKCQRGSTKERARMLWSLMTDLEGNKEFEDLRLKIKNGFKVGFDIRNVTDGEIEEYLDSNKIRIKGYSKISIEKYRDEMEIRIKEMKEIIRSMYNPFGNQEEAEVKGHG